MHVLSRVRFHLELRRLEAARGRVCPRVVCERPGKEPGIAHVLVRSPAVVKSRAVHVLCISKKGKNKLGQGRRARRTGPTGDAVDVDHDILLQALGRCSEVAHIAKAEDAHHAAPWWGAFHLTQYN